MVTPDSKPSPSTTSCAQVSTRDLFYLALVCICFIVLVSIILALVVSNRSVDEPVPAIYQRGIFGVYKYEEVDPVLFR